MSTPSAPLPGLAETVGAAVEATLGHASHGVVYDPWLVALSILVAIQGAYVGLSLAQRAQAAQGLRRRGAILGAAGALAIGIWSMHFIGVLAARLPVEVTYLVAPTLFSLLVCLTAVGGAMLLAATKHARALRLGAGGVLMGLGIVSMHYLGMTALAGSMAMHHAHAMVALSFAIAVGASTAALWLCFEAAVKRVWASAAAMALAISGMHYTAMAGMSLHPAAAAPESQFAVALSSDGLAVAVAAIAFAVSGAFLALVTPEPATADAAVPDAAPREVRAAPEPERPPLPNAEEVARPGPLGGAGARQRSPLAALTVERAGQPLRLSAEAIRCVRANAHYTYVRDAEAEYFCSLSIGDVEAALDPERFMRVHRSHIVNLDHVASVRRAGDNGIVEIADCGSLPVARARLPALKRRIAGRRGVDAPSLDAAE